MKEMKHSLDITILFTCILTFFTEINSQCESPNEKRRQEEITAFQKLKPLVSHRYTVEDEDYIYYIGICTDASVVAEPGSKIGVLQIKKNGNKTSVVIGKYSASSIMAGTNWIMLQYVDGQKYHDYCGMEPRKAVILFTCDPSASDNYPGMKMLEEENSRGSGCYYLFELAHPEICAVQTASGSLSIGSIILIVFFCVMLVYLIAGGLYQRLVLGAKGIEQLPNYEFWKDFGNLQADGCNLVCRAREARNSSPYKGLGDDQLEEPEDRDDNLLPM